MYYLKIVQVSNRIDLIWWKSEKSKQKKEKVKLISSVLLIDVIFADLLGVWTHNKPNCIKEDRICALVFYSSLSVVKLRNITLWAHELKAF